jgi:hypothetical protein
MVNRFGELNVRYLDDAGPGIISHRDKGAKAGTSWVSVSGWTASSLKVRSLKVTSTNAIRLSITRAVLGL